MIGIYRITNKLNNKQYIGQTNDIKRRFKEHTENRKLDIDQDIYKLGKENFIFEVLEECSLEDLDEREEYWIAYYNTYKGYGYNKNKGGGSSACENNGRTKLTNKDVEYIRNCYNNHFRRKEVYEKFKDKITFSSFASIWDGSTWVGIMPEVYTKENKDYYKFHATDGASADNAVLTEEEVMYCREQYVTKTAKEIYKNFENRLNYQTFQQMLWGRTYKNLPIYKKKEKRWINK